MSGFISIVGGLVALAFVALSALMNWSYGISRGVGEFDQVLLGAVSVAADVYKAIGLFFVGWALKHRRAWVWGLASAAWLVCLVYGVTSAVGYASLTRADSTRQGEDRGAAYRSLKAELDRKEQRRTAVGVVASVPVLDARGLQLKGHSLWKETRECRAGRRSDQTSFCDEFRQWQQDRAGAEEAERLDGEIEALRTRLARFATTSVSGDPQSDLMRRLTGVDLGGIATGLVVLFVVLVEMMSCAGLYIAFGHGEPLLWPAVGTAAPVNTDHRRVGDVARFAIAATREAPDSETDFDILYRGYVEWCRAHDVTALPRADFTEQWQQLAAEIEWTIEGDRVRGLVLADASRQ